MNIAFREGGLTAAEQSAVSRGFEEHSASSGAPDYAKTQFSWIAHGSQEEMLGVLTADVLWDWLYVDELWVAPETRGTGLGRALMERVEEYAISRRLEGIWLWTQSWQAAEFYEKLNYEEFTRFENFPRGHTRIGYRKYLASESST